MASTTFPSGVFTMPKGQGPITLLKGGIIGLTGCMAGEIHPNICEYSLEKYVTALSYILGGIYALMLSHYSVFQQHLLV